MTDDHPGSLPRRGTPGAPSDRERSERSDGAGIAERSAGNMIRRSLAPGSQNDLTGVWMFVASGAAS